MIKAVNLHRSYSIAKKQIEVLHGLDLHIRRGEKVFLCGPSGAGKTTLMYTLAGLEPPQQGQVIVDGEDIYALSLRRRALFRNKMMGFIFQNYMLMPELTALENASLATAVAGSEATERVKSLLERVGLADRMDHLPNELSGGEQQRIVIARAILNKPELILADEPTGNLDVETGRRIVELLKEICAQGSAILMITHNLNLLSEYPGSRIVAMSFCEPRSWHNNLSS